MSTESVSAPVALVTGADKGPASGRGGVPGVSPRSSQRGRVAAATAGDMTEAVALFTRS
jgi:hypothetical protein